MWSGRIETALIVIDGVSMLTVFASLFQLLPPLAALFTILWTGLRIYEDITQRHIRNKKLKRRAEDQSDE